MTGDDTADQARKGLVDSVKGKAKEIAGAVTGNDSLTAEGQLEQAQARERKEASSVEAVADAERAEALTEARDAQIDGVQRRVDVGARTVAEEAKVEADRLAAKQAAERAGAQDISRERVQAETAAQRETQIAEAQHRAEVIKGVEDLTDAAEDFTAEVADADSLEARAQLLRERAAESADDTNPRT